ncbi:MAG: hypothetical protein KGZ93_05435 [Actinobacteria bacterium]|nr:hypothetical protein [Actinomycetota bacterium]
MILLAYFGLALSILFLSAAWPPHNVYVADALARNDRRTVALIALAVLAGVSLSTALVAAGASLAKIPLSTIGGIIICITGVRMLFRGSYEKRAAEAEVHGKSRREVIITAFILALTPGPYAIIAAEGIAKQDFAQTAIVLVCDPVGVTAGGMLLAYGIRFVKLPLNIIGGIIVILIGLKMVFF